MSTPIPASKFYVPVPRSDLVSRPRLVLKLIEGLANPLILISAPAGFGKTTLIAEWHASSAGQDFPLAWLSLEPEDNDPVRFITCFISALESLQPGIRAETEGLVQSSPLKAILDALFPYLSRIPAHSALVLEDFHVITASVIHDAIAYFISHMPPCVHLILSSRTDPPLPLSRLRVRGDLTEIRTEELRFTHEETEAYLNRIMGRALSATDIDALETRTEGWIAGLKLAALSMPNEPDADLTSFISEFAGSHHLIADYLIEEVLNGQPEPVRNFLLLTSVLDWLSGPLCDAVTGQGNGQAILEQLDQENLFIVRLDNDRAWFRYHHLFGELLRHRLNQTHPGLATELHRRAAEWYEQDNCLDCAIDEALEGKAFDLAADYIEHIRLTMLTSGQTETLSRWVHTLPARILQMHPGLADSLPAQTRVSLTPREAQVLQLMGQGASNREIADTLVISTATVKKHLNNIFTKLAAQNRTQAVTRARELGLL